MHRVAVLIFDGIHSLDLAMPLQVFSVAHAPAKVPGAVFGERLYDLRVCGDGNDLVVHGVGAIELYRCTPPYLLADAADADTIVVIGVSTDRDPPAEALDLLNDAHGRGVRIASVSAGGARVMAASGLLNGRRIATHWSRADHLAETYPLVQVDTDALFIDHGDVITSAGGASGLDMCLHMVRQDFGSAVAADAARHLVVPPQRDGGQAPYIAHPDPGDDHGSLEPAMRWLRQRLGETVTLAEIAAYAGISPRTLNRRFREQTGVTPVQWLLRQRIFHAQELLETTDLPIEEVSRRSGFGTSIAHAPALRQTPQNLTNHLPPHLPRPPIRVALRTPTTPRAEPPANPSHSNRPAREPSHTNRAARRPSHSSRAARRTQPQLLSRLPNPAPAAELPAGRNHSC
ncbi:AraC family transcriptional regulator [Kribbella hippodromi]|uniref:AraC family transcriptional regulator n=1 Tax=Kribbella hippodromi TaxID=434347 RepID=A0ABN2CI34_9ACTN